VKTHSGIDDSLFSPVFSDASQFSVNPIKVEKVTERARFHEKTHRFSAGLPQETRAGHN